MRKENNSRALTQPGNGESYTGTLADWFLNPYCDPLATDSMRRDIGDKCKVMRLSVWHPEVIVLHEVEGL